MRFNFGSVQKSSVAGSFVLAMAGLTYGQDSVSNGTCLPGDAVSPWAVGEQCNEYVVDLQPFLTSWGTKFGIAPLIKTSKSTTSANPVEEFFGSLTSAQALSRTQRNNIALTGLYDLWAGAGFGVNDDTNTPPPSQVNLAGLMGTQFGVAVSEFATTDAAQSYNAIIGGIVQYDPARPGRLYVQRKLAAVNAPNEAANLSQVALGSVDADGNVMLRADDFGVAACMSPTCTPALTPLVDNSIFMVSLADRSCSELNVISNDFTLMPAMHSFDEGATKWIIRNAPDVTVPPDPGNHNPPGIIPAAVMGGDPIYLGTNFAKQLVRGTDFGATTADDTHFTLMVPAVPLVNNHRGNVGWVPGSCAVLNGASTATSIVGMLGQDEPTDFTNAILVSGLDAAGNPTRSRALTLPAVVTDPADGGTNLAGMNEFDHYHSQVAFRGGNGQVAMGIDQNGNLLAAGVVNHPNDSATRDWPVNYIAVARLNCGSGAVTWRMAAWIDFAMGKPVKAGPGGMVIGQLTTLNNVTGGMPFGPSLSAPMMDSVGNIWFLSPVELFGEVDPFDTALIRAVYDPVSFEYELEMILRSGQVFRGQNSGLAYQVRFLDIADNNSVSSGTAWSQNVSAFAHNGMSTAGLMPSDPRTLGGLVIAAGIGYDNDGDGFSPADDCDAVGGMDQEYNVLLYIGFQNCGNGVTDAGETCDDSNLMNGDGCSSTCQTEGFPCTTAADCRNATADNACNCATCTASVCVFSCSKYGNTNCDAGQLVNLDDILNVLAGFSGGFAAAPNADINPCGGNGIINLDDILAVLAAFSGSNPCGCDQAGTPPLCGSISP